MSAPRAAAVTGANSGIGLETARGLAHAGYEVLLLCRSQERAAAAVVEVHRTEPDARLRVVPCDLGDLSSVRRAAAEVVDAVEQLHVLVNNAGMTIRKPTTTPDGMDAMLAVNHLGPFLLTNLLLPLLERSAPSRVVNLASAAHKYSPLRLDDLQATRGYGLLGFPRYGETKLMNILFTRELARRLRGTGVTANCVHPGPVSTGIGNPPRLLAAALRPFFLTPAEGARTSLTVATDPSLDGVSGAYFVTSTQADDKLDHNARNDDDAARLWDISAELVGL